MRRGWGSLGGGRVDGGGRVYCDVAGVLGRRLIVAAQWKTQWVRVYSLLTQAVERWTGRLVVMCCVVGRVGGEPRNQTLQTLERSFGREG